MQLIGLETSLVIKDLVYEAKAKTKTSLKAKAKDMKIFQSQGQDFFLKAKDLKNLR